ncbi:MAG: NAD(P)H-binding protein, partial [Gemmatimonadota bacterium]
MKMRVLVLGATGTLGRPVVRSLLDGGHPDRVLTRSAEKARAMFGGAPEVVEGDPTNRDPMSRAIAGCEAVHVSLPTESELIAVELILGLADTAPGKDLRRGCTSS